MGARDAGTWMGSSQTPKSRSLLLAPTVRVRERERDAVAPFRAIISPSPQVSIDGGGEGAACEGPAETRVPFPTLQASRWVAFGCLSVSSSCFPSYRSFMPSSVSNRRHHLLLCCCWRRVVVSMHYHLTYCVV